MINLSSTTDTIQVVLGGNITTNQLQCFASYTDTNYGSSSIIHGRNSTLTNNTTAVNLVPSPSASTQRVIEYISVQNTDTVNATVSILFNDNGTTRILFRAVLAPNESMQFHKGQGWVVFSNSGATKNSINQGNSPSSSTLNTVILGSDVVNNNAVANTLQDVTGLSFPITINKTYYFKSVIPYTAQAGTTGSRWAINTTGSIANISVYSSYTVSVTASTTNYVSAVDTPAASNATSLTAGNVAIIEGTFSCTADGNLQIRFASEIAGSAITAKAGAIIRYQEVL